MDEDGNGIATTMGHSLTDATIDGNNEDSVVRFATICRRDRCGRIGRGRVGDDAVQRHGNELIEWVKFGLDDISRAGQRRNIFPWKRREQQMEEYRTKY